MKNRLYPVLGGLLVAALGWATWQAVRPRSLGPLGLRLTGRPQVTSNAMLITLVLSNGTSRSLNIVDDRAGGPFVVLDAGAEGNHPGTIGFGLGALANSLKLNLAPGAALTNSVSVTNPLPRFRLLVEVRDLAWERRITPMELLRFLGRWAGLNLKSHNQIPPVASPWIEDGVVGE